MALPSSSPHIRDELGRFTGRRQHMPTAQAPLSASRPTLPSSMVALDGQDPAALGLQAQGASQSSISTGAMDSTSIPTTTHGQSSPLPTTSAATSGFNLPPPPFNVQHPLQQSPVLYPSATKSASPTYPGLTSRSRGLRRRLDSAKAQ